MLEGFFRGVEAVGRERIPRGRPLLVVANHFNGFVDPVVLVLVLGKLPRFLAKATLWKSALTRPFLSLAGLIPLYRSEDRQGLSNDSAFAACHEALRSKAWVGIFPEGTTHDDPHLSKVRTGAARIALGARANGVNGIVIVPVGLTFEDRLALRSRVVAEVGRPIDLDAHIAEFVVAGEVDGEENTEAVRRLTEAVTEGLRSVSPDYPHIRERKVAELAAEITLRTHHDPGRVPLAKINTLAKQVWAIPFEQRRHLWDALARYSLDLNLSGVTDVQLMRGVDHGRPWRRLVLMALAAVLALPFVAVGSVVNVLPYLVTKRAGSSPEAPVSKGTIRFLVALGSFSITWIAFAVLVTDGWSAGLAAVMLSALSGWITVHIYEYAVEVSNAFRGWTHLRNRRWLIPQLMAERDQVVGEVRLHLEAQATT
jgi:1-acyl-sn-glycerol-3-phosphate acyltransferase